MSAPTLVAAPWAGWANPLAWAVMAFSAIVPGYLADVCQAKGQETVNPSESQVLLAGEPLFAAVFGAVLLGETLGTMGYVGGAGLVLPCRTVPLERRASSSSLRVPRAISSKTAS